MRLRFPNRSLKLAIFLMLSTVVLVSSSAFAAPLVKAKSKSVKPQGTLPSSQPTSSADTVVEKSSAVSGEPSAMSGAAPVQDDSNVGYARGELSTTNSRFSWRRFDGTKLAYKIGTTFDSFANELEQAQFFGLGVGLDSKMVLSDSTYFRAKGGASLSNGYAQSRFGDNVGKSGFYLDEAILSLRVIDSSVARLYVAAGGLDQGAFDAPLFISRQAFPGVKETLVLGSSKDYKFKIWAQQTMPTSKNLSTKSVDAEVTPSFLSETVEMTVQPTDSLKADAAITHFAFNNLPSAVSLESVLYGNTVDEIGPNTSRFKYRFDGLMARSGLRVDLTSRFAWTIDGYVVENNAAPEGYRHAQLVKTGFKIGLPGEIDILPTVGSFFVEDDAVPGFYNSSETGHNNRQGFGATLEAFFQRQRFKLKANYVDADVINYNINQSRQQTLSIGFETFYELL